MLLFSFEIIITRLKKKRTDILFYLGLFVIISVSPHLTDDYFPNVCQSDHPSLRLLNSFPHNFLRNCITMIFQNIWLQGWYESDIPCDACSSFNNFLIAEKLHVCKFNIEIISFTLLLFLCSKQYSFFFLCDNAIDSDK